MKKHFYMLSITICAICVECESENIEEKYYGPNSKDPEDTTDEPQVEKPRGEIAWYPFNGNLSDSSDNNIPVFLSGGEKYVAGINADYGKGLYLDGSSYLTINLGYYDTLSIIFWIKGSEALSGFNKPVLFDYGLNSISAQLDATSGATHLVISKNEESRSSKETNTEALNSFERYCFLYFEAGGDLTKVYFKGYYSNGIELVYNDQFSIPGIVDPQSEILYIGRSSMREELDNSYFQGAIDEIHIYSRCLSEDEVESFAFTHTE
jgi:hypothetical protein